MDRELSLQLTDLPILVESEATIRRTMEAIDSSALSVALLTDNQGRLIGVVTDGDIRRALLRGEILENPVSGIVNRTPLVSRSQESRAAVLDLMLSRVIDQIPVVDDEGYLVGLHTLRAMLGRERKEVPALLLAGGLGTRLGNLTANTPKPMLPVAGRPILERLVDHLVGYGIHDITLSVSYKAEQIIDYFGDGTRFGCTIQYLHEDIDHPRGSGGPFIDFVHHRRMDNGAVIVMNGDLVTNIDIDRLLREHRENAADISVAASAFVQQVPYGVLRLNGRSMVESVEEKPLIESRVNAGVYVIECGVARLNPGRANLPMTTIINNCLANGGRVYAMQMRGDWRDVGHPHDFARARGLEPERVHTSAVD